MGCKAGSHGLGQSWAPPPLCGGLSGTQGLVSLGRETWLPGSLGSRTGLPQHPGPLPRPRASSGRARHCRAGRARGPRGSQIWRAGSRVGLAPIRSSPRPQATTLSRCHPGASGPAPGLWVEVTPGGQGPAGSAWGVLLEIIEDRGHGASWAPVCPTGQPPPEGLRAGVSQGLAAGSGWRVGGSVPATHWEQALLNSSQGLPGGGGSEGREGCVRLQAVVDTGWEPSRTGSS